MDNSRDWWTFRCCGVTSANRYLRHITTLLCWRIRKREKHEGDSDWWTSRGGISPAVERSVSTSKSILDGVFILCCYDTGRSLSYPYRFLYDRTCFLVRYERTYVGCRGSTTPSFHAVVSPAPFNVHATVNGNPLSPSTFVLFYLSPHFDRM